MSKEQIKTYLMTDTHFCHERIINDFVFRPKNFKDKIIDNCQLSIRPQDVLIHLGDVIWGNKHQLIEINKQIPGRKILVRGNHDKTHSDTFFYNSGFSLVCQQLMIDNIILSHMPIELSEDYISKGVINIHGHFHNMPYERWEESLKDRLTDNHYLFSLETVKYRPVLLKKAIKNKDIVLSKSLKNKGLQ